MNHCFLCSCLLESSPIPDLLSCVQITIRCCFVHLRHSFQEHPSTTIVTDARTIMSLTRFITDRGGLHCLYRVGYKNVIDKGVQLNKDGIEAHLMMETSGHGAHKENHFLDDGVYMVVNIIIEMVR